MAETLPTWAPHSAVAVARLGLAQMARIPPTEVPPRTRGISRTGGPPPHQAIHREDLQPMAFLLVGNNITHLLFGLSFFFPPLLYGFHFK
jgi:hypothetical protein